MSESAIPQWKKDLIARLRSQNKRTAHAEQLFSSSSAVSTVSVPVSGSAVQQPVECSRERCGEFRCAMVHLADKSDSDEDLHYGPGIVSKLKERYLSLAQRDKPRPSILRKAASLENILDQDPPVESNRLFQPKHNVQHQNRYLRRGMPELKRARSVETISTNDDCNDDVKERKRESLHEEMLIANRGSLIIDNGENNKFTRINRPKRIAPVMNEKEKPPADVVKQAKKIFERRPEQRTRAPQQTGEVAIKVANFKNLIQSKKPPVKVKPLVVDKPKTNGIKVVRTNYVKPRPPKPTTEEGPPKRVPDLKLFEREEKPTPLPLSPIPDISRIDFKDEENGVKPTSLTETPDLIVTSSPLAAVNSPNFRIAATENFLKEEKRLSESEISTSFQDEEKKPTPPIASPTPNASMTFNFANSTTSNAAPATKPRTHPPVNKNVSNTLTPPSQPLKVEINGVNEEKKKSNETKPPLTTLEIKKNLINTTKTYEQPDKNSVITKSVTNASTDKVVPKVKNEDSGGTLYFNFLGRKDVPDYVQNDGLNRAAKPEKPKVGEGGIIILEGAIVDESFTDEDEEILRSLEGPPSPCDVTFINDNILIDGKSSLSQKTKRTKARISFVIDDPEVYEYPSESSLIDEPPSTSPPVAQIRNSVPSLSGTSSLANYTPKGTEDFQPGISRSVQNFPQNKHTENSETNDLILQEVEKPILFSATGANSDILF